MYIFDYQLFVKTNKVTGKKLAQYLGVTDTYISYVKQGKTALSEDKIKLILANPEWDTSMIIQTSEGHATHNITATASNHSTATNHINGDAKDFIKLLEKKDEQMDRLISVIEKLTDK